MTDTRADILRDIATALGRGAPDAARRAELEGRLAKAPRNLIPDRAERDPAGQVALFVELAAKLAASTDRVASLAEVPAAVADWLAEHNLPAKLKMAPDPALAAIPWATRPLLEIATGAAEDADRVGVTPALAAIAETGTLVLTSGSETPATLNFLPDTHIVVLRESQIVGNLEDAWDRIRERFGKGRMPRTINLISGPSRTGDIDHKIVMGAHGPRRLHIVLVKDEEG